MIDKLTDRKMRILEFIIEEYIRTAEPVGSRTISKNKKLGVSAATIRNEMSDLEEMGFLVSPHVSAGRIPSEEAYSFYVDKLICNSFLSNEEKEIIETSLIDNFISIESLVSDTIDLMINLTNYVGVGVSKKAFDKRHMIIEHFDLINYGSNRVVMLLVMKDGFVKNAAFTLNEKIDKDKFRLIVDTMRENIVGREISFIDDDFIAYVKSRISEYSQLIDEMVRAINKEENQSRFTFMMRGATNIFDYPEFSDASFAKSFLTMLDDESEVMNIISSKGVEKGDINIVIGDESMGKIMENCSIITADFSKKDKTLAKIGIIGPKRMDYQKIYSILQYISDKIKK